jgi:hypothetical protein
MKITNSNIALRPLALLASPGSEPVRGYWCDSNNVDHHLRPYSEICGTRDDLSPASLGGNC